MPPTPLLVLMYHHICPPPATAKIKGMYVRPGQFDWHISWLKRKGFTFTTFRGLSETPDKDARQVILTFDDGFANNYDNAFPILQKHDVRAVIFPVFNDIGRTGVVWPKATEQSPADMMTAAQIKEMAEAGIEFGSHLLNHRHLTAMTPREQVQELARSKEKLEALLASSVDTIAYPFGDFDGEVVERTRKLGYNYGVITEPGLNYPRDDPLKLKRYTAKGCKLHHPWKFIRMIGSITAELNQQPSANVDRG